MVSSCALQADPVSPASPAALESDIVLYSRLDRLRIGASIEGFCNGLSEEQSAGQFGRDYIRIKRIGEALERRKRGAAAATESDTPVQGSCDKTVSHERRDRFEATLKTLERRLNVGR